MWIQTRVYLFWAEDPFFSTTSRENTKGRRNLNLEQKEHLQHIGHPISSLWEIFLFSAAAQMHVQGKKEYYNLAELELETAPS